MSDPIHLKVALVVKGAFDPGLVQDFVVSTGIDVEIDWAPTTVILADIENGARPDGVIITNSALNNLVDRGLMNSEDIIPVVSSRIGVGVRAGSQHPDIATVKSFILTLTSARSVAYSLGGQSGLYFGPLLDRLGIAEGVNAKATLIPAGFTGEKLLTGEADIAIQQISELKALQGVEVVGGLPDEVQKVTAFSGAPLSESVLRKDVLRFLNFLSCKGAVERFSQFGLDPR